MNKTVLVMVMTANGLLSGLASAEEVTQASLASLEVKNRVAVYDLIQERGYRCLECHDVDKKVVGPAWKEVAAKRKSHKWAEELIVFKISNGSVGEYGTVVMTHNDVRQEDARVLAKWILSLWSSNP